MGTPGLEQPSVSVEVWVGASNHISPCYGNRFLCSQCSPAPIYSFAPTRLAAQAISFCRVVGATDAVARLEGSGRRPLNLSEWWTFNKSEVCAWFFFVFLFCWYSSFSVSLGRRIYCFKCRSMLWAFFGGLFRKASSLLVEPIIITFHCPLEGYGSIFPL